MLYSARRLHGDDARQLASDGLEVSTHAEGPDLLRIDDSVRFLLRFGLSPVVLGEATAAARRNGSLAADELMAKGAITPELYHRALALDLGLAYELPPDPASLRPLAVTPSQIIAGAGFVTVLGSDNESCLYLGLNPSHAERLRAILKTSPNLLKRLRLAEPKQLRRVVARKVAIALAHQVSDQLRRDRPQFSARVVATGLQGFLAALFLMLVVSALLLQPGAVSLAIHAFLSLFFLSCVALRVGAASRRVGKSSSQPVVGGPAPFYSVIVPLHEEAEVIADLVGALKAIDWPASRIEFLLMCEEDDAETFEALKNQQLDFRFDIIRVPVIGPRTKPKALMYALAFARGEFIVVYDAEDRPHPGQLREAWSVFARNGDDLACLQAPLEIANGDEGLLQKLFQFEYAALFRGLLPWLADGRRYLPLGGTSNHFRRAPLIQCGGWDPWNVTEDADLGLRLVRDGYRVATIGLPTLEDAPHTLRIWMRQRTRWYKGWLQTWLVHSRAPFALAREMPPVAYAIVQTILIGVFVSALLHPVMLLALATLWFRSHGGDPLALILFSIDLANIILSYMAFGWLAWTSSRPRRTSGDAIALLAIPAYWMLMSFAAWRALFQLWRKPFLWEKTPHRRHYRGPGTV